MLICVKKLMHVKCYLAGYKVLNVVSVTVTKTGVKVFWHHLDFMLKISPNFDVHTGN